MRPVLLSSVRGYGREDALADLLAGITVAMVAIPLSLAIAIASGASPGQGLITAIVAGFLISALGGSTVQIGGPTGAFIVVVAGVITAHGIDGLITATFLAGLILIAAGLMRAGNLVGLVPESVINGFTIGIAAIIATSQIKDLFGMTLAADAPDFLEKLPLLWQGRGTVSPAALGVGLLTIALIVVLRRWAPRWPGLIVAVALGSALAAVLPGVETLGDRFGALPDRLPMPRLPDLSLEQLREVFPAAFVIAFLAGIESLLSAIVADRMTGRRHRSNAEVLAQGTANLASALFGGLPATGAIARTATNVRAGGRTPVAGMIHALVILLVMMLAAPMAVHLAMPSLAALLMLTAWNMSEPAKWAGYLRSRRSDQVLLILTFLLTLLVSLTVAIGVGVGLGLALRLRRRASVEPDWEPGDR